MRRLDHTAAKRIKAYLAGVLASGDPRSRGLALTSQLAGKWRYRVGDLRVIVEIQDSKLVVIAIRIGHRSHIYQER